MLRLADGRGGVVLLWRELVARLASECAVGAVVAKIRSERTKGKRRG